MGANASQLEKQIGADQFPSNEHYFGLENFGNTCYCNSVLQALYFCKPFRERVLEYKWKGKRSTSLAVTAAAAANGQQQNHHHGTSSSAGGANKENLLTCLAELYHNIATQKKKTGTIAPKKFINRLRKENELFDNYHQQDAHEFLNYLLNTIADILREENKATAASSSSTSTATLKPGKDSKGSAKDHSSDHPEDTTHHLNKKAPVTTTAGADTSSSSSSAAAAESRTWIHDIFEGTLTNETRCLTCECLSSKDEDFLDLSIDVEDNTSITHCLRVFSHTETLSNEHKYYCENCCSKQEAEKRMRIKRQPNVLAIHLKRFKYMESQSRHTKLSCRVAFPLELRLFNKTDQEEDRIYDLVSIVIHCGPGPNRGHYISVVKSAGFWLLFDDEMVEKIDPSAIEDFYGSMVDTSKTSEIGYILFYQSRHL